MNAGKQKENRYDAGNVQNHRGCWHLVGQFRRSREGRSRRSSTYSPSDGLVRGGRTARKDRRRQSRRISGHREDRFQDRAITTISEPSPLQRRPAGRRWLLTAVALLTRVAAFFASSAVSNPTTAECFLP